jgi:L-alanine-DL-glutamate epimerase-like enolase superfamily enzyme
MATIARVEVGRFDYEQTGEFKFFKAPVRPSIVVRLTDENGVQGWGQSVPIETWTLRDGGERRDHAATLSRAHHPGRGAVGSRGRSRTDGPRCGGLWNASRIVALLRGNNLLAFGSGLTDPDLSLAAIAHLFAWAGLDTPTALNGPQYIAGRGTTDPAFRANGDMIPVPTVPGLGITVDASVEKLLSIAAQA